MRKLKFIIKRSLCLLLGSVLGLSGMLAGCENDAGGTTAEPPVNTEEPATQPATEKEVKTETPISKPEPDGRPVTAMALGNVYDMNDGKYNQDTMGDTWSHSWLANGEVYMTWNDGTGFDNKTDVSDRHVFQSGL